MPRLRLEERVIFLENGRDLYQKKDYESAYNIFKSLKEDKFLGGEAYYYYVMCKYYLSKTIEEKNKLEGHIVASRRKIENLLNYYQGLMDSLMELNFQISDETSKEIVKRRMGEIYFGVDSNKDPFKLPLCDIKNILVVGTKKARNTNFIHSMINKIFTAENNKNIQFLIFDAFRHEYDFYNNAPFLWKKVVRYKRDHLEVLRLLEEELIKRLGRNDNPPLIIVMDGINYTENKKQLSKFFIDQEKTNLHFIFSTDDLYLEQRTNSVFDTVVKFDEISKNTLFIEIRKQFVEVQRYKIKYVPMKKEVIKDSVLLLKAMYSK